MSSRLQWTEEAFADLDRLEAFLYSKSPSAAEEAIDTILAAIDDLRVFPLIGRSVSDADEDSPYREFIVPFSNSGYLVLYVDDGRTVEIHRVRHQSEAGY